MNQNYQTRLAEILDKLLTIGEMYTPEDVAEAQQQITELFLEIIGEDENEYTTRGSVKYVGVRMGRNQLRASLRKAISEETKA